MKNRKTRGKERKELTGHHLVSSHIDCKTIHIFFSFGQVILILHRLIEPYLKLLFKTICGMWNERLLFVYLFMLMCLLKRSLPK